MSSGPVHFEVYARSLAGAPWTLDCATESRAGAIEVAKALLAERRALAVRVTKEVMETDGGFRSFVVFTDGEDAGGRAARPQPAAAAPICSGPPDLYTVHARERIARLLDAWLRRRGVTAFELLHRPDLAEALEASGSDLQHAIQKIAVPEAQATGASTHQMVRAFQALADGAIARLLADGRRGVFPDVQADFEGAARALSNHPDAGYLLGGGVAACLASADTWRAKADRLMDLAERAPAVGRARALALATLEQPLSEILGSRGGVADLVGAEVDLGGALAVLTRLAAAPECRTLAARDAAFARALPPLSGAAARLARLLELNAFEGVCAAIGRRLLTELRGPRRLRPGDPEAEIAILRALAMALTASAGRLLPLDDVQAAFVERSRHIVGSDFVEAYLQDAGGALAEVQALARLAENVVGVLNKRACARWVSAITSSPRLSKDLRASPDSAVVKLAALAAVRKALVAADLPDPEGAAVAAEIGTAAGEVEATSGLTAVLARGRGAPVDRLTALLKLAAGEAAPPGPAADRARAEAMKLLREPEVRRDLAERPGALAQVKALLAATALAA